MKTYLLALVVLLVITKDTRVPCGASTVRAQAESMYKIVNFLIYANGSYKAPAYKEAFAQLEIYITREERNEKIPVWNKAWQFKQLNSYPSLQEAARERVIIGDVKAHERLQIEYVITYFTKGSILKISRIEPVVAGGENAVYVEV